MHDFFTTLDWIVLFSYLALTTLVGHALRGSQSGMKDFFLGGRTLPWWAICGSIIATEISGVTFIGVAGGVLSAGGDFGYMIWGVGSIIGRIIVGLVFVKVFFQDGIYSPYDYMGQRISPKLKNLATVFFTVGAILGQSVRVLVAALPLKVVTPFSFELCIIIIGLFAIVWTLMGGMRTVIWTDVMQFVLFSVGGLISLFWIVTHLPGGWTQYFSEANEAGKFAFWDPTWGFGPELQFTFWVALLAVPFQNLTAFGVDQLNAQRMFCCRNARDASKAIIVSSIGQLLTLLMLMVGAALFVWYANHPPEGVLADYLAFNAEGNPKDGDRVFPAWIVSELPAGLSGLILAAVFAAAISSLDSILAALSQTTVSMLNPRYEEKDDKKLVKQSKMWVLIWGVLLTAFTLLIQIAKESAGIPILPLAFGMTAYTMGPLLAMFVAALLGRGSFRGLAIGSILSFLLVMIVRVDIWILLEKAGILSFESIASFLPTMDLNDQGSLRPKLFFAWMWPLSFFLTLLCGLLVPSPRGNSAGQN